MTIRVLIADDHPLIVEGLRAATVATEIEIVGQVESCAALKHALSTLRPNVLISEIRLGRVDVIRELEFFASEHEGCAIVFFSANDNPTHLARANALGCHDFVSKKSTTGSLLAAVRSAAAGAGPSCSSRLKTSLEKIYQAKDWSEIDVALTPREKQVLQHLAMGMTNREIGRSLSISSTTVKEYVQKIMRKLDANDRTQAAVWAVREGII